MCCILYIPSGIKTPPQYIFRAIHRANPHGIGYVDTDGHYGKTLDLSVFLQAIKTRRTESACIIHLRYATHGSICERNCHPFLDPDTDIWFAHNGVLPISSHDDMTDGEIFFRERFIAALGWCDTYDSPELWRYVDETRGTSRFIFMRGDSVKMLGQWHDRNGVFYSNLNWLSRW